MPNCSSAPEKSIFTNPEFDFLKGNGDYNKLLQMVEENAFPCRYGDEYKRLDFWLGEWDVYVNENYIGESFITKSLGGCTLYEDYRTTSGFLGRSMNYYDPVDSLYKQIWIDKNNGITNFKYSGYDYRLYQRQVNF